MSVDPIEAGVLNLLRSNIRAALNERADHIAGGGAADYPEYRHQCGVIEGLALAERELLDLIERIEKTA